MPFDYDSAQHLLGKKSRANFEKHGIDFEEAQALWNDHNLIEIPAKVVDEPRYMVVGRISGRHWSAVITYRGENIRIISVRRSREEEIELYESL
ncbi:MAG: BrnT family toxin [Anaerolineales bacterium]|nr:BrnT family toxin [Anaerolineales bacterium]MDO9348557.1 BrnT family toxin [Anaerolineales bacterium]